MSKACDRCKGPLDHEWEYYCEACRSQLTKERLHAEWGPALEEAWNFWEEHAHRGSPSFWQLRVVRERDWDDELKACFRVVSRDTSQHGTQQAYAITRQGVRLLLRKGSAK